MIGLRFGTLTRCVSVGSLRADRWRVGIALWPRRRICFWELHWKPYYRILDMGPLVLYAMRNLFDVER